MDQHQLLLATRSLHVWQRAARRSFLARGWHRQLGLRAFQEHDLRAVREDQRPARGESFNLFNRTQFGNPGNYYNPTSTGFGWVTSQANNPRLVQIALRLMF